MIFYIDNTTYYETYPRDVIATWSNVTGELGSTGSAIGTGITNTAAIIAQSGHTQSSALICSQLKKGVDSDFFTATEFEDIMIHINAICNSEHWLSL